MDISQHSIMEFFLDGNVPVIEEIDRICDAPQKAHLAKYIEPFLAPSSPVRQHMQKWL